MEADAAFAVLREFQHGLGMEDYDLVLQSLKELHKQLVSKKRFKAAVCI